MKPPIPISYYFFLQALLANNENQPQALTPLTENLITSLKIHGTLMHASLINDGLLDTITIYNYLRSKGFYSFIANSAGGQIVKKWHDIASISYNTLRTNSSTIRILENALSKTLANTITRSKPTTVNYLRFSKALTKVSQVLSPAFVIMSASNYANAENSTQKKIYGTQLGFDSAGLVLLATPLAPFGIPLAFLSMSVNTLQRYYAFLEEIIKANVLDYFNAVKNAYQGAYYYDVNQQNIRFLNGAVFKSIDLETGEINFDTQRLCLRDPNHVYRVTQNTQNDSIDLRQTLLSDSIVKKTIKKNNRNSKHIILPNTPKSFVSYDTLNYQTPTKFDDSSEAVGGYQGPIRTLERANSRFSLQKTHRGLKGLFFVNTIYQLFHQYQNTIVKINLGNVDRLLEVPDLPHQTARVKGIIPDTRSIDPGHIFSGGKTLKQINQENKNNNNHEMIDLPTAITYHLTGKDGQYSIALRRGADFKLYQQGEQSSTWIFDARLLKNDTLKIEQTKLKIGDTNIVIDASAKNSKIFVINKHDQTYTVNLNTQTSKAIQFDVGQYQDGNTPKNKTIITYIKKYIQENNLSWMNIIPVVNFHVDGINSKAYYQLDKERILLMKRYNFVDSYIHSMRNKDISSPGKLGAIIGDEVYFIYTYKVGYQNGFSCSRIWKVNANTGNLLDFYEFPITDTTQDDNLQMWQEGDHVFISRKVKEGLPQAIYQLKDSAIEKVSMYSDIADFSKLTSHQILLPIEYKRVKYTENAQNVEFISSLILAPIFTCSGIDQATKLPYRYWVHEGQMIKANMPDSFVGSISDLVLVSIMKMNSGEEVFYFFNPDSKLLYRQVGKGIDHGVDLARILTIIFGTDFNSIAKKFGINTIISDRTTLLNPAQLISLESSTPIINTFINNNFLFVTNEIGIVYQVDETGKFTIQGISEIWLKEQGSNWLENLKNILKEGFIPIIGLKGIDGETNLKAWYGDNKLIIASELLSNHIYFVGIYGNTAYFLDSEREQLYQQEIIDQTILKNSFGDDHILDFEENMSFKVQSVAPNLKIKSVSILGNGLLKLTTKDMFGAVFVIDNSNELILVGFTQEGDYNALKNKYTHAEVVPLKRYEGDTDWYHFDLKLVFPGHSIAKYGNPQYLATNIDSVEKGGGIYFQTDQGIIRYKVGEHQSELVKDLINIELERLGDILVIKSKGTQRIQPIWFDKINTMLFQGRSEMFDLRGNNWNIPKDNKRIVIINNSDLSEEGRGYEHYSINIELQDPTKTQITRQNDDLLIMSNKYEIVITNIFEESIDQNIPEIRFQFDDIHNNKITLPATPTMMVELISSIKKHTINSKSSGKSIYPIYNLTTNGSIYALGYNFTYMDNSLEIKGTEENEYFNLKSQWVQEAKSVRLCGGGGEDFYEIDLTTTEKHSLPHITIDNLDINKAKDYLKIFIKEYNKTKLSRKDNDLHIFNEADHIFIKNIFADNKADYNHLSIEFIGQEKTKSFEVDVIVNKWIALDDSNQYLNSRHLPLSDFERYLIPISSLEK